MRIVDSRKPGGGIAKSEGSRNASLEVMKNEETEAR